MDSCGTGVRLYSSALVISWLSKTEPVDAVTPKTSCWDSGRRDPGAGARTVEGGDTTGKAPLRVLSVPPIGGNWRMYCPAGMVRPFWSTRSELVGLMAMATLIVELARVEPCIATFGDEVLVAVLLRAQ